MGSPEEPINHATPREEGEIDTLALLKEAFGELGLNADQSSTSGQPIEVSGPKTERQNGEDYSMQP